MTYRIYLWFLGLLLSFGIALAADPSFSFVPASGSTLKLYCTTGVSVYLNASSRLYSAFDSYFAFDQANLTVTTGTVNTSIFSNNPAVFLAGNPAQYHRAYGATPSGIPSSSSANITSFSLTTKANITGTTLRFVDLLGNTPTLGLNGTDDGNYLISATGTDKDFDILSGLTDATYNFLPLPCSPDVSAPVFLNYTPTNGVTNIPTNQVVSFLVYDWQAGSPVSYWYSGLNTSVLSNYVAAPAGVDNQEGVNSGSLKVTVSCPTCSGSPLVVLSGSALTVVDWTGQSGINQWTWDSKRRGYAVSFNAPFAYEVEKLVTITGVVIDNPNETGQIHTGTISSYTFNAPAIPTITRLLPAASTFVSPVKTSPVSFYLQDLWAGVNTGTIKFTIPAVYSGGQLLMTGYTYSGSDFASVTLSGGGTALGSGGKYVVTFYPKWDLPANTGITITGSVSDLAGNAYTSFSTSFTTRPDCSYFGCNEVLSLTWGGSFGGTYTFTGSLLVVTGTNSMSPYPYLSGANHDILYCGFPWTGATLTGNVPLYSTTGADLRGIVYTGDKLYITGLNFTIQNGIIVVQ